jgi:hypothetical protein
MRFSSRHDLPFLSQQTAYAPFLFLAFGQFIGLIAVQSWFLVHPFLEILNFYFENKSQCFFLLAIFSNVSQS